MENLATRVGRLKHWQVFFPIVGMFLAVGVRQSIAMNSYLANRREPDFAALEALFVENIILSMPIFAVLLFWIWSIAYCSTVRASTISRSAMTRVSVALLFAFIYMCASPWVFPFPSTAQDLPVPIAVVGIVHTAAVFGLVYAFGVAAKVLVSVERESRATFHEYLGTFFLIWFFPIGIWNVQPRLNAIILRAPAETDIAR